MSTAARRSALNRIIERNVVTSQAEIAELLADAGHPVTQATVSRDLAAIGASKSDTDGGAYVVSGPAAPALISVLERFVLDVIPTGNLVVVHTPPGAAQVVARAVDGAGNPAIAGTVAGDDTVLVVAAPKVTGTKVAALLLGEAP